MGIKQNPGHLSKRQRAIIDDLIKNGLNEYEILDKYKISPCRYKKWLENELFVQELDARIAAAARQARFALIHSQPKAIDKLMKMIDQEKGETARKACLDIIELRKSDAAKLKVERIHHRLAI